MVQDYFLEIQYLGMGKLFNQNISSSVSMFIFPPNDSGDMIYLKADLE